MSYLYLFILVFASGMITVIAKFYNNKNISLEGAPGIYNVLYPLGAAITYGTAYFLNFAFEPRVLVYSLLYGSFYTLFTIGNTGAIKFGISSITALVKQTALVGVSVWGFIFFAVPVTVNAVVGVILIIVALCLCLVEKSKVKKIDNRKKDLRLPLYLLMIAIGNVGCPLTHKYLLVRYNGNHGYMMLFFAVLISATFSTARSLKDTKKHWRKINCSLLRLSSRFFGRQQRNNRHNANNTSQYEYVYVDNLSNTCGWRFDSYARIFGLCFQRKTSPCPVVWHSRWLCGAGAVEYLAAGNKG